MAIERHPYGEFIPKQATGMIIGSFPIGKFTDPNRRHEINAHEFDFFFGGQKNLLWKLISQAVDTKINSKADVIKMLTDLKLGVGDVIKSCSRKNGGASDSDLLQISFNLELIDVIKAHKIKTLYFTSKKVEHWFNRLFPNTSELKKVSLISPSAQTLRSLGANERYQKCKEKYPHRKGIDFIYAEYRKVFSRINRE